METIKFVLALLLALFCLIVLVLLLRGIYLRRHEAAEDSSPGLTDLLDKRDIYGDFD